MIVEITEWLQLHLPAWRPFVGQWQASPELDGEFIFAVQADGGGAPVVDVRYPIFRVLLLGPKNGRQHQLAVMLAARELVAATLGPNAIMPCGAANIRALSEPLGPGLTVEKRPWASISFQLVF